MTTYTVTLTYDLLFTAVYEMFPHADFYINGDGISYSDLVWEDQHVTKPTEDVVMAKAQDLYDNWELWLVRQRRNKLLKETDHWAYQDTTAMTTAQTNYRQSLRDITDGFTDIDSVTWPTKP